MNLLPGLGTKLAAVVSAAVLMGTVAAPAHALQDTVAEHSMVSKDWRNSTVQVAEQQSADSMPDNPNAKLPDSVSEKISADAMVVSEDLAVTPQGEVKDVQSGKTVKDKDLVGTQSQQPDPLAKTDGESFIPVSAQDVKEAVDQNKASQADNAQGQDSQSDDSRTDDATESEGTVKQSVEHTGSSAKNHAKVRTAGFGSNEYGAHWGTYDGNKAFFDYQNNLFAQQAKGVIDVSSWQGDINWTAAKADGVEGAIIRLGYGWGNAADSKAKRNISECKRLGIPFGIYWYSYAYDANTARQEGQDVAAKLRQLGVSRNDLAYPVFYDLERWTWTGHRPPTDPNVYSAMVNSWYSAMQSGGYTNLGVYSYTSYLQGPLNNANVYSKTRWVAQYGAKMGYSAFGTNDRGWQYTSSGHVNGISGNVDMNAFGYAQPPIDVRKMNAVNIPNGDYYINVRSKVSSSIDIPNASTADSTAIQLYSGNGTKAQQFTFTRQQDGSYVITNVNSGKVLDVWGAAAHNNAVVQQYSANGSNAQRWFIRDSGTGYYLQSALGNWVLDLSGGNTANGAAIRLYTPNGSASQLFVLSSSKVLIPVNTTVIIKSAEKANLVFDVSDASTANYARIQMYTENGNDAQKFYFRQIGNGTYNIINVNSGKVLDVYGAHSSNGTVLQQFDDNSTIAQQWTLRDCGNGKISFISVNANRAIDVPNANFSPHTGLWLYTANGSNAQQWVVEKSKTVRERLNDKAAKHKSDLPNGTYIFGTKLKSTMKLDIYGGSRVDHGNAQIWAANGTNAQRWRVVHDKYGYVVLTSVNSGKVLDVNNANTSNDTNVQQFTSNNTYAQKWIATKNMDGSYTFYSALAENMVLDVSGGYFTNATNVQLYESNGSNAQKWLN